MVPVCFQCFYIFLLLFVCFKSLSSSTFNCNDTSSCSSSVYNCVSGENCYILCNGDNVCADKTFNCPSNGECHIKCGTNNNHSKSCYSTVFTTKSNTKILNITTFGYESMSQSTVFCPQNINSNCSIYSLNGYNQLNNLQIYAVESFINIYVYCNNNSCYNNHSNSNPIIYCSETFESSCTMLLKSNTNDKWKCIEQTSMCNIITDTSTSTTTSTTTSTSTNTLPTTSTSTSTLNPIITDTQSVKTDTNSSDIMIGGMFGIAFLVVFSIFCGLTIYINKTKSALVEEAVCTPKRESHSYLRRHSDKHMHRVASKSVSRATRAYSKSKSKSPRRSKSIVSINPQNININNNDKIVIDKIVTDNIDPAFSPGSCVLRIVYANISSNNVHNNDIQSVKEITPKPPTQTKLITL